MTPKFAATLLTLSGWGFVIFGLLFVTIAFPNYDGFAHSLANLFDWTGGPHTEELTRDARWYAAIMSGFSAGFGGIFIFLIAPILRQGNVDAKRIARRGGILATALWFLIDSTGSLAAGVPSNVVMNAIFLTALTGPLLLLKVEERGDCA